MNVIAVPALAFAGNWQMAALLVIAERTGKALRGPARDVLLSEATAGSRPRLRFRPALDHGSDRRGDRTRCSCCSRVARSREHFGPAFLWLVVPAIGTLLALTAARFLYPTQGASARNPGTQAMPKVFWYYVAAAGLLAFGFVDFPLLACHFENASCLQTGQSIPLLYAGAMGVNGITAFIFGQMFDRFGSSVLVLGTLVSMLSLPLGFPGRTVGGHRQRRLLGRGAGRAGCIAALRHRAGGFDEQARQRFRRLQRSVRRDVVSGKLAMGLLYGAFA